MHSLDVSTGSVGGYPPYLLSVSLVFIGDITSIVCGGKVGKGTETFCALARKECELTGPKSHQEPNMTGRVDFRHHDCNC